VIETERLELAGISAEFAPAVAMVCCSLHAGDELLVPRGGLRAYARDGGTMGVPLLHPWANRLAGDGYSAAGKQVSFGHDPPLNGRDPAGLPIHGCRPSRMPFEVTGRSDEPGLVTLTTAFDTAQAARVLEIFPFPHRLVVEARLEPDALTLTTTLIAGEEGPVPVSFGYHPYLRLPGVARDQWQIDVPVRTGLVLDEQLLPTGERRPVQVASGPLGERTFDDAYAEVEPGTTFALWGEERRITVTFLEGYPFAQMYAPPGQDLICFEPMTAPGNALVSGDSLHVLEPGEEYRAAFRIAV
jgi:galactose mutarotase-like enzyme